MKRLLFFILLWFAFPAVVNGQTFETNHDLLSYRFKELHYVEFQWINHVGAVADYEKYDYIDYKLRLPPGVDVFDWSRSITSFCMFFYKHNESIFIISPSIRVDPPKEPAFPADADYEPTLDEVDSIINHYLLQNWNWNGKQDESSRRSGKIVKRLGKDKPMKKGRKNFVIMKDGITIILFNIKKENIEQYQELVSSIKIIDCNKGVSD